MSRVLPSSSLAEGLTDIMEGEHDDDEHEEREGDDDDDDDDEDDDEDDDDVKKEPGVQWQRHHL